MKNHDSNPAWKAILAAALLSGCVATGTAGHSLDLASISLDTHSEETSAVSHFHSLCLRNPHVPEEGKALALHLGWREAADDDLEKTGLRRLRKTILAIPGGGARFHEEQEIMAYETGEELLIASMERRIAGRQTRSTQCSIYARSGFFKTCEEMGRLINRAPDRNQAYPDRKAHFIQWKARLEGKGATLGCSITPQSAILPYDGVVLSVHLDHSGAAQKTAFRQVRSSQPVVAGSGR